MKQGIQTNFRNIIVRNDGCYLLCLIELGGRLSGRDYEGDIMRLYSEYVSDGAMKSDCTILDPAYIMRDLTGKKYVFTRPKEKPDYPYYIIENTKPYYTHFTLFYNGEIWDPLDPAREAAKLYKPNSYRLLIPNEY